MTEYDCLLKVEYFIYDICDDSESDLFQFGTDVIPDLKAMISGKRLVVALDQATKKTGVCILDFETRKLIAVLDLINTGFPNKSSYFESIYCFLANHIKDEEIVHFIYEIPIEHSKNTHTLAVLESLRMFVRDFRFRMPSLSDENMVEIYVTAWRGHFLADKRYDGKRKTRDDAKESTRQEVCRRFTSLCDYAYKRSEPPDSCDAVGIACGALEEMYSQKLKGFRRVNKTMPVKNNSFKYEIIQGTLQEIIGHLKTDYFMYENHYEVLEFNPEMSVEENAKRYACNNRKLGILLVPDTDTKTNQLLKWETGKPLAEGEYYSVFCRRPI